MFGRIIRIRPALLLLSVAGILAAGAWLFGGPSYDELRSDGEQMTEAVERYRRETGSYPESLEEAEVEAPDCPYGWRYVCYGGHYRLSVGDADRDGWVLTYRSALGAWRLEE